MKATNFVIVCSVLMLATNVAAQDLYTSLTDLKELQHTEYALITTLQKYINSLREKVASLKRHYNDFQEQHKGAEADIQNYLSNPINIFLLIKRLTTDWMRVESLVFGEAENDFAKNVSDYKEQMKFPNKEDLKGAAVAIRRLQQTYLLEAASLARGEIDGVQYSSKLTAADCFELGKQLFENHNYDYAQLWMQEADARLEEEIDKTMERQVILEYWAITMYKQGNISLALNVTNKLLEINPTHQKALEDKIYYEDVMKTIKTLTGEEQENAPEDSEDELEILQEVSDQLCRNETSLSMHTASKLKCYYITNNKPFLLIAPFKVEEAHDKPKILIFHDVISDSETETVMALARPKLIRASYVNGSVDGKIQVNAGESRINKVSWLGDHTHKTIEILSRRTSDMTSLSTKSSEPLQAANYGIGGHFNVHIDAFEKSASPTRGGDRIATLIFYMNDVAKGGATVFPKINATLLPQKGTAAFWYNLDTSGKADYSLIHAACPVLTGSKWIATKWLHEIGQEFIRPCGLEEPQIDL